MEQGKAGKAITHSASGQKPGPETSTGQLVRRAPEGEFWEEVKRIRSRFTGKTDPEIILLLNERLIKANQIASVRGDKLEILRDKLSRIQGHVQLISLAIRGGDK